MLIISYIKYQQEMKVNWATTSGGHQAKLDSSSKLTYKNII